VEVIGQLHTPAALPPQKEPSVPTEYDDGLAPEPELRFWKTGHESPEGSRGIALLFL
jgi:hypothetical protein